MPLPEAGLEAWDSADPEKLGGIMELAGLDPASVFLPRAIRDHPWLGLDVEFPFAEIGKGKITHCLIHPKGQLLFDVTFPEPVPPIHGTPPHFRVVGKENLDYYQTVHRFYGHELKALLQGKDEQRPPLSGARTAGKHGRRPRRSRTRPL
jgi:hypothetical protein